MADKVIPFKQTNPNEIELSRVSLHDSEPTIAVSKTLGENTMPGAKIFWEKDAHAFRIEKAGQKRMWVAQTNAKAWYEK